MPSSAPLPSLDSAPGLSAPDATPPEVRSLLAAGKAEGKFDLPLQGQADSESDIDAPKSGDDEAKSDETAPLTTSVMSQVLSAMQCALPVLPPPSLSPEEGSLDEGQVDATNVSQTASQRGSLAQTASSSGTDATLTAGVLGAGMRGSEKVTGREGASEKGQVLNSKWFADGSTPLNMGSRRPVSEASTSGVPVAALAAAGTEPLSQVASQTNEDAKAMISNAVKAADVRQEAAVSGPENSQANQAGGTLERGQVSTPVDANLGVQQPVSLKQLEKVASDSVSANGGVADTAKKDNRVVGKAAEKFAAPGEEDLAPEVSGVKTSEVVQKKNSLNIDNKRFAKSYTEVGTNTANQGETTMFTLRHPAELLTRTVEAAVSIRGSSTSRSEAVEAPQASQAAKATQVVNDIHEMAMSLPTESKKSVELKFDFNNQDRVAVKLELKDGVVHTTFHSSSSELTETIAAAWASKPVAADAVVKMAEPTFNTTPSENRQTATDGGAGQRQQGRQQTQDEQSGAQTLASFFRSDRSTTLPRTSTPVVASDRHLQAFA